MKRILLFFKARAAANPHQYLNNLSEFIYLLLIFVIPLYFSVITPTYNIFELGKLFIFKSLVLVLLSLTLFNFLFAGFKVNRTLFIGWARFLILPWVFIFGLGISLFFSGNPELSFFGSYDRQAGYLSYLYYFVFFILLVVNLLSSRLFKIKDSEFCVSQKIKRLMTVMTFSGLIVAIYAILQRLGFDFLTWPEDPLITGRAFSSLGQVNFLASWLVLIIPLSVYLGLTAQNNLIKFFYSLNVLFQIIALLFSASRGGVIALFFVTILVLIYFLIVVKIRRFKKIIISLSVVALLAASVFLFATISPERFKSLGDFSSGSLAVRIDFYQAAIEAWQQKPFFGYGLENGANVFLAAYQPDWGVHSNVGVQNDKAHNLILDIALSGGLFLIVVFVLFYYYIWRIFYGNIKNAKQENNHQFIYLNLALGAGALAYLLSLLFSFSFVAGEIYFFAYVAILTSLYFETQIKNNNLSILAWFNQVADRKKLKIVSSLFLVVLGGVLVCLMVYEYKIFRADNYFFKAYHKLYAKQYLPALELLSETERFSYNPINTQFYLLLAGQMLGEDYWQARQIGRELDSQEEVREKLKELDRRFSSQEFTNLLVRGKIKAALGQEEVARELWQEAATLAPYWPRTYLDLARSFRSSGLLNDALAYNNLSLQILPVPEDNRLNTEHRQALQLYRQAIFEEFGKIYITLNDYETAENFYQKAYQANIDKIDILKKIADTYYLRQDLTTALHYILHGAARQPKEYSWFLAAAILFQEQGKQTEAAKYFQASQELLPHNMKLPAWPQ